MKRELPISIKDNWYSDLYPTWCDFAASAVSSWEYRTFGNLLGIRPSYKIIKFFRTFEIFFYRRAQLDYFK